MIPLAVPNLTGNEAKYLNQCIETTFISSVGEFVTRIEKMACEASDADFAVASSSGTTGLHLALMGVGVERDDLVIVPSFTFIATANAVAHCCAIPWVMDIDPKTWTLNAEILEKSLREETVLRNGKVIHKQSGRKVSAIMPVYTLGMPAEMDTINRIAKQYSLPVVADAAAALGARYKDRNLGKLADLTVFSFNGNKTVTCGGGGMIIGNNEDLLKKIRHISTTARVGIEYNHDMVGYNYRMTNIQAAVGCAQLERLGEFVNKKRMIRDYYKANISGAASFPDIDYVKNACWFSGIILDNNSKMTVKEICEQLKENGIEGRTFWKPIHLQKPYENAPCTTQCYSENIWQRVLTLPCSTNITDSELKKVSDTVNKILKK